MSSSSWSSTSASTERAGRDVAEGHVIEGHEVGEGLARLLDGGEKCRDVDALDERGQLTETDPHRGALDPGQRRRRRERTEGEGITEGAAGAVHAQTVDADRAERDRAERDRRQRRSGRRRSS